MNVPHRPSPEEIYLDKKRAELAALESQLTEKELELHTMRGGLLAFERQYDEVVKSRYDQLDELKIKIAELAPARSEREEPAQHQADGKAQAKGQPRPVRRPPPAKPKDKATEEKKPADFNPAESLKRLYRDVAKTIHPDLADNDANRAHRHQFMVRANEAYEAGDEKRLLAVFQEWEEAPESVKGEGAAAELVRVIRKIARCEQRIVTIAMEEQEIQTSGLFGMKMMAEEASQFERDLLGEMTGRLDAEIEAAKAYLAMLEQAAGRRASDPHADPPDFAAEPPAGA